MLTTEERTGVGYLTEHGQPWYLRVVMLLLGVPNLVAGAWAIASPQSWFDDFPGWAPSLVAAYPPFNEHLAVDAGAGLFASGLVITIAAVWNNRNIAIMAALAYLAFALPHAVWHWINPSDELAASEDVMSTASLVIAVAGAAFVLAWQWRRIDPLDRTE